MLLIKALYWNVTSTSAAIINAISYCAKLYKKCKNMNVTYMYSGVGIVWNIQRGNVIDELLLLIVGTCYILNFHFGKGIHEAAQFSPHLQAKRVSNTVLPKYCKPCGRQNGHIFGSKHSLIHCKFCIVNTA